MPDPEMVSRAHRAAATLEQAWERWRVSHGLAAEPMPPVSSYVGYSIEEPWGRPRVVFGMDAHEAEVLAALLEGHEQGGLGAARRPLVPIQESAGPGGGAAGSNAEPAGNNGVRAEPAESNGVPTGSNGVPAEPAGNNGVPAESNGVPADDGGVTEGRVTMDEIVPTGAGTAGVGDQSPEQAQPRPEGREGGQSTSAERAPVARSRSRSGRRPFTPRPAPDHAGDLPPGAHPGPGQDPRDADEEGPSGPAAGRKEGSDTIVAELAGWAAGELPGQASARLAAWAAVGGVPTQGQRESGTASTGTASTGTASTGTSH
jgi:hypothetical protein